MPRRKVQVEGQLDLLSINKGIEKAKKENPVPEEKVAKKETSKRTRKTTTNVRKNSMQKLYKWQKIEALSMLAYSSITFVFRQTRQFP